MDQKYHSNPIWLLMSFKRLGLGQSLKARMCSKLQNVLCGQNLELIGYPLHMFCELKPLQTHPWALSPHVSGLCGFDLFFWCNISCLPLSFNFCYVHLCNFFSFFFFKAIEISCRGTWTGQNSQHRP